MAKITGLGGVFFKSSDPAATATWLREQLGVPAETWGHVFPWLERDSGKKGYSVLGLHAKTSDYFTGSDRDFMLNLRVDDLEAMLAQLSAKGIEPIRAFTEEPNGRFAHIPGPDGITIELWQPADPDPYDP